MPDSSRASSLRLRRRARPLQALALAFMGLWALLEVFGPRGISFRDETICFYQGLCFIASGPLALTWGNGNLLKLAQFSLFKLSGWWPAMHIPALAAVLLQALALYAIGKRLGGPRVGRGAALASALSAFSILQARSLLPFSVLPALLALGVALALCGRSWRWAFAGGLVIACGFLEYEAVIFALPGVAALLFLEPKLKRPSAAALGWGLGLGSLAIVIACRQSLQEWWLFRMTYNRPWSQAGGNPVWTRVWGWFAGAPTEAYMGVNMHSSVPTWALALAFLGLGLQARRRPWLWFWLVGALIALWPNSVRLEPQRAGAALLPMALAAGFGWQRLWVEARCRPWLAGLLALLPLLGCLYELRAYDHGMSLGQDYYLRSEVWLKLHQDPQVAGQVDGGLRPLGLTWETISGRPLQPSQAPYVWVPTDLDRDAPQWPGQALHYDDGSITGDLLMKVPLRDPLRQDLAFLRPFWLQLGRWGGRRGPSADACRRALQERKVITPLGRVAIWDALLDASAQARDVRLSDLHDLDLEGFRSPFFYRARMIYSWKTDLRLTYCLCSMLKKYCGADRLRDDERNLLGTPWELIPPSPGSPDWPQPSPS